MGPRKRSETTSENFIVERPAAIVTEGVVDDEVVRKREGKYWLPEAAPKCNRLLVQPAT